MEMFLNHDHILALEHRKRAALINSLTGFKSVNLIGTIDSKCQTNLAIFNSAFHLGANPALVGFVVRPDSVDRHTLSNILETGFYTINHVNKNIYIQAHQTSARYAKETSEFTATKLSPEYKENFSAPYVKESLIKLGLNFKQRIDIELNGTIIIVGEITQIYLPKNCMTDDGFVNIEKAGSLANTGLDSYHTTSLLERLSYAKTDKPPASITSNYLE